MNDLCKYNLAQFCKYFKNIVNSKIVMHSKIFINTAKLSSKGYENLHQYQKYIWVFTFPILLPTDV